MSIEQLLPAFAAWLRSRTAADNSLAAAIELSLPVSIPVPLPLPKAGLFVPAYFRDDASWNRLYAAAANFDVTVIANPASGPGPSVSAFWTTAITKMSAIKSMLALGYVSTRYGNRPAAEVHGDIKLWYDLYPNIKGIFFDEQATDSNHVAQYTDYFADVHSHGGVVASNPGTSCDPGYYTTAKADVLVLWEKAASAGSPILPSWAKDAPDAIAAGLVHDCDSATLENYVATMRSGGYGWIFVTSASGWSTLGLNFDTLVDAVKK